MVNEQIIKLIKTYIQLLNEQGLSISKAYLYGSYAKGTATEESDIDLMLISPLFDENTDKYASALWLPIRTVSYKIEPYPVGENRFKNDTESLLLQIVREEGIEIAA